MARLTINYYLLQKSLAIRRVGPFNPILIKSKLFKALNKNPNSIWSKAISKSWRRKIKFYVLCITHFLTHWAIIIWKLFFVIHFHATELVWLGHITFGKCSWILLANNFASISYMLPRKVMDHELPNRKLFPNLGIKVINLLFMNFEVYPTSNIFIVASRRVQANIFLKRINGL
jgi:hypothetical protein